MKTWSPSILLAVMLTALTATPAASAGADPTESTTGTVQLSASLNGQDLGAATAEKPLRLDPHEPPPMVVVTVTNNGASAVNVQRVQFAGNVVGLSFFSYDTAVRLTVAPGETGTVGYGLDVSGLEGQATGMIGGTLEILDEQAQVVASVPTVTDVRGSLTSVYGLFGLALLVLTVFAIADAALSIARHRLMANRWRRGMRLLTPGIGIGLVLVFTLSAAGVWVPTTGRWLIVAGLFACGFFLLGYLSPTPDEDNEDFADEIGEDDLGGNADSTVPFDHGARG